MRAVRVFLDNSLEVAIAALRLVALLGALALGPLGIAAAWDQEGHLEEWVTTLLVVGVMTLASGFVGFYTLGNPEWRRGKTEHPGA